MKASPLATPLTRFALLIGSASAGLVSAQPAPPAGAGLAAYPPGAVQPPAYQMQMPTRPQAPKPPPGAPPAGYQVPASYRPPTMQAPPAYRGAPLPAKPATTTKSKSSASKSTTTPKSNYRPATGGTASTKAKTGSTSSSATLESRVGKLESSDHRQDLRLGRLERDVGLLPQSIEGGGMADIVPAGKTHIVRPGDTLFSIASRYSTSVGELRSLNRLSDERLDIGETLLIPDGKTWSVKPTQTTAVHVVSGEENLAAIARMYGVTEDSIARANPSVYASDLRRGERLTILDPTRMPAPVQRGGGGGSQPSNVVTTQVTHTVKKGEMLGRIASKHGVSMSKLMAANGIKNPDKIVIGQKLIIPGKQTTRTIVPSAPARESDDTTPLPHLRLVEADQPSPPQVTPAVIKPSPAPALPPITKTATTTPEPVMQRGIVSYRAQRGDSIESVASLFGTSVEHIRTINQRSADKALKEGEEIFVPTVGAVSLN